MSYVNYFDRELWGKWIRSESKWGYRFSGTSTHPSQNVVLKKWSVCSFDGLGVTSNVVLVHLAGHCLRVITGRKRLCPSFHLYLFCCLCVNTLTVCTVCAAVMCFVFCRLWVNATRAVWSVIWALFCERKNMMMCVWFEQTYYENEHCWVCRTRYSDTCVHMPNRISKMLLEMLPDTTLRGICIRCPFQEVCEADEQMNNKRITQKPFKHELKT